MATLFYLKAVFKILSGGVQLDTPKLKLYPRLPISDWLSNTQNDTNHAQNSRMNKKTPPIILGVFWSFRESQELGGKEKVTRETVVSISLLLGRQMWANS